MGEKYIEFACCRLAGWPVKAKIVTSTVNQSEKFTTFDLNNVDIITKYACIMCILSQKMNENT